jgi:hypothetical protein
LLFRFNLYRYGTGAAAACAPPPASRCAGHALFPHRAGVLLVGAGVPDPNHPNNLNNPNLNSNRDGVMTAGGATAFSTAGSPPPVYLLEMPAAREGRRLRAAVQGAVEARGGAEDRCARATAAAAAAADEVRLVRAAAGGAAQVECR